MSQDPRAQVVRDHSPAVPRLVQLHDDDGRPIGGQATVQFVSDGERMRSDSVVAVVDAKERGQTYGRSLVVPLELANTAIINARVEHVIRPNDRRFRGLRDAVRGWAQREGAAFEVPQDEPIVRLTGQRRNWDPDYVTDALKQANEIQEIRERREKMREDALTSRLTVNQPISDYIRNIPASFADDDLELVERLRSDGRRLGGLLEFLDSIAINPRIRLRRDVAVSRALAGNELQESSRDKLVEVVLDELAAVEESLIRGQPTSKELWRFWDAIEVLSAGKGLYENLAEAESKRQLEFMAMCDGMEPLLDVTLDKKATDHGYDRILLGSIPMLGIDDEADLAGVEVKSVGSAEGLRTAVNSIVVGTTEDEQSQATERLMLYETIRSGRIVRSPNFNLSAMAHLYSPGLWRNLRDGSRPQHYTSAIADMSAERRDTLCAEIGTPVKDAYREATYNRSLGALESRLDSARRRLDEAATEDERGPLLEEFSNLKKRHRALKNVEWRNLSTVLYGRIVAYKINPDNIIPSRAFALFDKIIVSNLYGEIIATHGLTDEQCTKVHWARREFGRRLFDSRLTNLRRAGVLPAYLARQLQVSEKVADQTPAGWTGHARTNIEN